MPSFPPSIVKSISHAFTKFCLVRSNSSIIGPSLSGSILKTIKQPRDEHGTGLRLSVKPGGLGLNIPFDSIKRILHLSPNFAVLILLAKS